MKERLGSFVNVEAIHRDRNDQIDKLRFKRSATGKEEDGTFIGIGVNGEEGEMSIKRARQQFPEIVIKQAIAKASRRRRRFVFIPPGDASDRSKLKQVPSQSLPEINYRQKDMALCLWASTASALHVSGLLNQAVAIFAEGWVKENATSWSEFSAIVHKVMPTYETFTRIDLNLQEFISITKDFEFVVGQLVDSLGNSTHCICVYKEMIFDSNERNALRLSIDNLDRCVYHPTFPSTAAKLKKVFCLYQKSYDTVLMHRIFFGAINVMKTAGDTITQKELLNFFNDNKRHRSRVKKVEQVTGIIKNMVKGNQLSKFDRVYGKKESEEIWFNG